MGQALWPGLIKHIYEVQEVEVVLEGYKSKRFFLHRGVRQGCPLSPLLFNIIVEVLALKVRQQADILGVQASVSTNKMLLFADDMSVILQEPERSLKVLQKNNYVSLGRSQDTKLMKLNQCYWA